jgi:hypothetical protein
MTLKTGKTPFVAYLLLASALVAPAQVRYSYIPPVVDTVSAGDSLLIAPTIVDDTGGLHPEYDSLIHWTLSPEGTRSFISKPQGAGIVFHAVDAYKPYSITGTFYNPTNPFRVLVDSQKVFVKPGPPHHLSIEASPDSATSPNADNRLGSLTFPPPSAKDSVYAVLRDEYGNFAGYATAAVWTSRDTSIVTAAARRAGLGEGEIARQPAVGTSTYVVATQAPFKDSTQVILTNITYSQIRIVVRGDVPIDTLRMRTDQDTTLSARGLRSDGGGTWDSLRVTWSNSGGLSFNNTAPQASCSWTFNPLAPSTGKLFIAWGEGGRQLGDTIVIIIPQGDIPIHMVLYPAAGPPSDSNKPYPPQWFDTVGGTVSLAVKVFAGFGWLGGYERPDVPVTWKIEDMTGITGSGVLDGYAGYMVTFTGLKAYQTVRVIASLDTNGVRVSDSVAITMLPAPREFMYIEPDSTAEHHYRNQVHRAEQVTLGVTEAFRSVYAVLRDTYGNFIKFSDSIVWVSRDTTIVKVTGGNSLYGEGKLSRVGLAGRTYVIARSETNPDLFDSVLVVLSECCSGTVREEPGRNKATLQIEIPGAGRFPVALPPDLASIGLSVVVYSLSGKMIFREENIDGAKSLSLGSLAGPGIYMLVAKVGKKRIIDRKVAIVR